MTGFLILLGIFGIATVVVYLWSKNGESTSFDEYGYKLGPEDDHENQQD
jgi:hypothetical protein